MKLASFGLGIASGLLVLVIVSFSMRLLPGSSAVAAGGAFQRQGANTARMAQRMGITEAELQKELASGKTFQQIAEEHGVTLPARGGFQQGGNGGGNRPATGSGSPARTATGSITSSASSPGR